MLAGPVFLQLASCLHSEAWARFSQNSNLAAQCSISTLPDDYLLLPVARTMGYSMLYLLCSKSSIPGLKAEPELLFVWSVSGFWLLPKTWIDWSKLLLCVSAFVIAQVSVSGSKVYLIDMIWNDCGQSCFLSNYFCFNHYNVQEKNVCS